MSCGSLKIGGERGRFDRARFGDRARFDALDALADRELDALDALADRARFDALDALADRVICTNTRIFYRGVGMKAHFIMLYGGGDSERSGSGTRGDVFKGDVACVRLQHRCSM